MLAAAVSSPPPAVAGAARFAQLQGWAAMFAPGRLTLGVFFPIEAYRGSLPTMQDQERLARKAEALGYAALWFRDVPLFDPQFGDAGQIHDPWVYLGWIAAHTSRIALATGSIVLPIRHPLHTAKAAASVHLLSGGRLVMGVATGDRPVEYAAFGVDPEARGALFEDSLATMRRALERPFPTIASAFGVLDGADLVPKPGPAGIPMLVTGNSRKPLQWIARQSDGWITYPRALDSQARVAADWRAAVQREAPGAFKPFAQSLYVDLAEDPGAPPEPIHLGWRVGRDALLGQLRALQHAGVNHVALNLKYGRRPAAETLEEIGEHLLPHFRRTDA